MLHLQTFRYLVFDAPNIMHHTAVFMQREPENNYSRSTQEEKNSLNTCIIHLLLSLSIFFENENTRFLFYTMKTFLISVDEKAKRWGTKLDLTEAHEPPNVYGLLSLMRYFVFHNFDVRVFFSFFGSSLIFLEIQNHKTDWRRFEKERV